jgi:hypothetical protein
MTYEQEAIEFWQARINEQEYPSDYGGQDFWEDDGWVLSVSYAPTQTKQEEIAFNMFVEDLEHEDEDNVDVVRFTHWACGWVKQINVRPIFDGKLTKAGEMVYEYHNDNGMDYLERAYEREEYYEWEWQEYLDFVSYTLEYDLKNVDADAFTDEDKEAIVSYLHETGQVEVDGHGGVYQWCFKTDDDWYEALDELMGDKQYKLEEAQ